MRWLALSFECASVFRSGMRRAAATGIRFSLPHDRTVRLLVSFLPSPLYSVLSPVMNRFLSSGAAAARSSAHAAHAAAAIRHFSTQFNTIRRATTNNPTQTHTRTHTVRGVMGTTIGSRMMSSSAAAAAAPVPPTPTPTPTAAADATTTLQSVREGLTSHSPPLEGDGFWSNFHFIPEAIHDLMIFVHSSLPDSLATGWVPTIAIVTILFRASILPVAVIQQKNTVGLSLARPEMQKLNDHFKQVQMKYNVAGIAMPLEERMRQSKDMKAIMKKYNCSVPRSLMMPFILMPTFVSMFVALRTLGHIDPSYLHGGMLWFENLGQLDQGYEGLQLNVGPLRLSLGLPLINSALIALTVKTNSELSQQSESQVGAIMKKVMYGFAFLSWPFCSTGIPTGVIVYWIISNVWGILQAKFLRSDLGRNLLGIPKLPNSMQDMDQSFERFKKVFADAKTQSQGKAVVGEEEDTNPFEKKSASNNQPPVPQEFFRRKRRGDRQN